MNSDHEVVVAPSRMTQLEQALEASREYIADIERRHEAAEESWAALVKRLQSRVKWLEAAVSRDIVRQSRHTKG